MPDTPKPKTLAEMKDFYGKDTGEHVYRAAQREPMKPQPKDHKKGCKK